MSSLSDEDASEASSSSGHSTIEPPDHVVILYASETGDSQDIAERTGREFRRLGRRCIVISMDMFDIFDLPHIPLLILITSTHGHGDPPPAMKPLWSALIRSSLPTNILEDVSFALYGLGDSSYEKFCYAGKMLARRMEGLSAVKLGEPAWGDERAPDGLEETFLPWLQQTVDLMLPLLPPPPEGFEPEPLVAIPPPIYSIDLDSNGLPDLSSLGIKPVPNGGLHLKTTPTRAVDEPHGQVSEAFKPDGWGWATFAKNRRVTPEDWWQDVREIEFDVPDEQFLDYLPGSICCLHPKNSVEDIDAFLRMSDLASVADDPIRIRSAIPDQPLPSHLPPTSTSTTLRSLLTNHLDLRDSPLKSFFEWLRRFSPDETEQERLDDFIGDPDEIHTYATRPSRTILETLADFRHTRFPLSHIFEILPPLRRRQFSIASTFAAHPGKIQLLITMVEYKTNLKVLRKGLCSTWLQTLPIGTRIPINVKPPTMYLPPPDQHLILIGPGTGVAPMRALIEERVRQGAAKKTALYFGCRSRSADLYYASEWKQYEDLGLKVRVAASRDQGKKIYVQNIIKEDSEMIKAWLYDKRGSLFISGSSNSMPRQVRETVAWCVSSEGSGELSSDEATAYVEGMFEDGRGLEESW